jgi:hypothetical protein
MWCQQRNSFAHRCPQSNVASTATNAIKRAEGLLVEDRKASFGYVQPFAAIVVFQSAAISAPFADPPCLSR